MALTTATACEEFLNTQEPQVIADRIRHDQFQCSQGGLPSILAWHLPHPSSEEAAEIATCLLPDLGLDPRSSRALQEFSYTGIIDGIKAYLESHDPPDTSPEDGSDFPDSIQAFEEPDERLEAWELSSALKVLQTIRAKALVSDRAELPEILATMEEMLSLRQRCEAPIPPQLARDILKKCYICRFVINQPHKSYPSMCQPCGAFNLAEASLSLPDNLNLRGRIALITAGRVNLGFHTALRLLRCGASVIVSSRYPQDAELRYLRESDSEAWVSRLKIVGADFRRAKDVFSLVRSIAYILNDWKSDNFGGPNGRLDILINSAAQTLTDPVCAEEKAIQREGALPRLDNGPALVINNDYEATVRGGSRLLGGLIELDESLTPAPRSTYTSLKTEEWPVDATRSSHQTIRGDGGTLTLQPEKSSWVQTLREIPYEDLISAHSVNTFVPLILIRELLPFMARSATDTPAHIINVSSREGIFEAHRDSPAKGGHHVHTNMSKAALNMITETEAATAWRLKHVAMNTVDPGYMSAAPEMRGRGECPIGFDDGAARVLWPVALAEKGERPLWGRFLKHFGRVHVEVGLGR